VLVGVADGLGAVAQGAEPDGHDAPHQRLTVRPGPPQGSQRRGCLRPGPRRQACLLRLAIGVVVVVIGIALHRVLLDVTGAVIIVIGAVQWVYRSRGGAAGSRWGMRR
jgi:hypothetical protein